MNLFASAKNKRTFSCTVCDEHPDDAFTVFSEGIINDWMIYYPDLRLIHVHYRGSSDSDDQNIRESGHVKDFCLQALDSAEQPLFLLAAFQRMSLHEKVPKESLQLYDTILTHPNFGMGAITGATTSFRLLINGWMRLTRANVRMVKDTMAADDLYVKWTISDK